MAGQLVGYARVSTKEQNLDLQLDALKKVGCVKIFYEKVSALSQRKELDRALEYLRAGDSLVIWRLDRLGRSLKDLVTIIEDLRNADVGFKSLNDGIDTSSPMGKLQFGIFAALAEYEREIIVQRTKAGLEAAKKRGKVGGRKPGLNKEAKKKAASAKKLYLTGDYTADEICTMTGIGSKATLYKYLEYLKVELNRK